MSINIGGAISRAVDRGDEGGNLGNRFRRSLKLSLLNTLLSRLGTFAMGVLLARLLAPEEFGIYATALVVQNLLLTFNDMGTAAAVVRHNGNVKPLLRTAWTVSVFGGVVAFLICLMAAPALATALGSPHATDIVRFLAVNALLDGFAAVPGALLTRELRQARRLVADLSGTVLNLVLTGALALAGFGPWALAIGHVSGTALVVVLLLALTGHRPSFGFDREHFREVAQYGVTVMASALLLVVLQSTPQAATGTLLGATALGFFYIANNVANWPVSLITTTVERVALATFARAKETGMDLNRAASGVIGLVAVAAVPGGIALAMMSGDIVRVVYGKSWMPAAAVLSGLAVAAVARVLCELVFNLLVAVGATLSSVLLQVVWLAALVPATVFAGMHWGLAGIGWAQAVVALFVAFPVHAWGIRQAGLKLSALAKGLALPAFTGLIALAALFTVRELELDPLLNLVVGGVVTGALVGIGYFRVRHQVEAALNPSPNGSESTTESSTSVNLY
ncbi:lipopolysaccharide biosynthesis protein [Pseudonocardiaceae bacterium YIM PH 21723]|nr:lipopolysaccharide biosynthesis protein [Pseudonocardiaceae bacterium YIM PH 21723]